MIGGKIASNTAKLITIGVYIFANLAINLSEVDFFAADYEIGRASCRERV